jgi:hypothetical protein
VLTLVPFVEPLADERQAKEAAGIADGLSLPKV